MDDLFKILPVRDGFASTARHLMGESNRSVVGLLQAAGAKQNVSKQDVTSGEPTPCGTDGEMGQGITASGLLKESQPAQDPLNVVDYQGAGGHPHRA